MHQTSHACQGVAKLLRNVVEAVKVHAVLHLPVMLALLLPVLSGCAHKDVLPIDEQPALEGSVARKQRMLEQESAHMRDKFRQQGLLLESGPLADYVRTLMASITKDLPDGHRINTYVLRDPNPNAFAAPNGDIYFTAGLLAIMEHRCEIDFIARHELAHYVLRHPLRGHLQRQSRMVTASVVDTLLVGTSIAYIPAALGSLSYSRDMEREADNAALRTMADDNKLAKEIEGVFARMQKFSPKGNDQSIWNSHPSNQERSQTISAMLTRHELASCAHPDRPEWTSSLRDEALSDTLTMALLQKRQELVYRLYQDRNTSSAHLDYLFGEAFRRAAQYPETSVTAVRFMEDASKKDAEAIIESRSFDYLAQSQKLLEASLQSADIRHKALRGLALVALARNDPHEARRLAAVIESETGSIDRYLTSQITNWKEPENNE